MTATGARRGRLAGLFLCATYATGAPGASRVIWGTPVLRDNGWPRGPIAPGGPKAITYLRAAHRRASAWWPRPRARRPNRATQDKRMHLSPNARPAGASLPPGVSFAAMVIVGGYTHRGLCSPLLARRAHDDCQREADRRRQRWRRPFRPPVGRTMVARDFKSLGGDALTPSSARRAGEGFVRPPGGSRREKRSSLPGAESPWQRSCALRAKQSRRSGHRPDERRLRCADHGLTKGSFDPNARRAGANLPPGFLFRKALNIILRWKSAGSCIVIILRSG